MGALIAWLSRHRHGNGARVIALADARAAA
jgi:hypothetical protein